MSSFEPAPESGARRDFVGGEAPWLARTAKAAAAAAAAEAEEAAARGRAAAEARDSAREHAALERAAGALEAAAQALRERPPDYLALHRHCAVELALAIARAVLAREVRSDPNALAACVERALAGLAPERPLRLRLASPEFAALSHGLAARLEQVRASADLAVVEDPALEPGDFALEGAEVEIEARLPEILSRVAEALAAEFGTEAA